MMARANVEIFMAVGEDVPELAFTIIWLVRGGLAAMQTASDASIVILSAVISIFHMLKCVHRYLKTAQMMDHAKLVELKATEDNDTGAWRGLMAS